ncbi:hypothetical protein GCM10010398_21430 [Streptomyces fimbriatus]
MSAAATLAGIEGGTAVLYLGADMVLIPGKGDRRRGSRSGLVYCSGYVVRYCSAPENAITMSFKSTVLRSTVELPCPPPLYP